MENLAMSEPSTTSLSGAGAATEALASRAHQLWTEAAGRAGLDLSGFDPAAPLADRVAWARARGLGIAAVLSRFSSKLQHSTAAQIEDCITFAAWHRLYTPPEYLCVDEAVSGRKARREGLDRVKQILKERRAETLLVFKVSRLFRVAYKGYAFFEEELVEEGLRGVSVSQGIDTRDEKTWKGLTYLHGIMDEMLLEAIADHVRSGIKSLFLAGYVTGALPVGYRPAEVPGARPTNRGRPRTMPQVVPEVAERIREHFRWIRDGMGIKEGWRRWVAAGGPHDPRSTLGHMSYAAYRRMLSNPRYTGLWAFGRKMNVWSSKRDYTRQVLQADTEVAVRRCEELRIVPDDLFADVQKRLADLKRGPRGPKKRKQVQLWDLTTDLFWCARCQVRFYQAGANGRGMRCKRGDLCPAKTTVRRREAVRAVCDKLTALIRQDASLVEQVVGRAQEINTSGDDGFAAEEQAWEKKIVLLSSKIADLLDLAGQGTEQDRLEIKAKLRAAQAQRAGLQAELARLRKALAADTTPLTPEGVRAILAELTQLLEDAAGGQLGDDVVYRALAVFRQLVGGRIEVHVERRPGRQRSNVRGVFRPELLRTVQREGEAPLADSGEPATEVEVWLRQPPRLDRLAQRVHELLDIAGLSYREAAAALKQEGHAVNSGNVWYIYRRYYAMHGLPVPQRPYNNGRPRRRA
jgi:DNA invertase Pin-like site-specific DNA recombinase